jgi:hypothetical protein
VWNRGRDIGQGFLDMMPMNKDLKSGDMLGKLKYGTPEEKAEAEAELTRGTTELKETWDRTASSPWEMAKFGANALDPTGAVPGVISMGEQSIDDVRQGNWGGLATNAALAAVGTRLGYRNLKNTIKNQPIKPQPQLFTPSPYDVPRGDFSPYPNPHIPPKPQPYDVPYPPSPYNVPRAPEAPPGPSSVWPQRRLPERAGMGTQDLYPRGPRGPELLGLNPGTPFRETPFRANPIGGQPVVNVADPSNINTFGQHIDVSQQAQGFGNIPVQPGFNPALRRPGTSMPMGQPVTPIPPLPVVEPPVPAKAGKVGRRPRNAITPDVVSPEVLAAGEAIPEFAKPVTGGRVAKPKAEQPVKPPKPVPISKLTNDELIERVKLGTASPEVQAEIVKRTLAAEKAAEKAAQQAARASASAVEPTIPKVEPTITEPPVARLPKVEPVSVPDLTPVPDVEPPKAKLTDVERKVLEGVVRQAQARYKYAQAEATTRNTPMARENAIKAMKQLLEARKNLKEEVMPGAVKPKAEGLPAVEPIPKPTLPKVEPVEPTKIDLSGKTRDELIEVARTADDETATAIRAELAARRKAASAKGGTTLGSGFGNLQDAPRLLKQEFDDWRVLKNLPENQESFERFMRETGRAAGLVGRQGGELPDVEMPSSMVKAEPTGVAKYADRIEEEIAKFEADKLFGSVRAMGDPKKLVIPEINMTEADISDLRNIRKNRERENKFPPGGRLTEKFKEVFPEYKNKEVDRIIGYNEGAVTVKFKDGTHAIMGRDDITDVALPEGRDYHQPGMGYGNTVMRPERFDKEGNFIPQESPEYPARKEFVRDVKPDKYYVDIIQNGKVYPMPTEFNTRGNAELYASDLRNSKSNANNTVRVVGPEEAGPVALPKGVDISQAKKVEGKVVPDVDQSVLSGQDRFVPDEPRKLSLKDVIEREKERQGKLPEEKKELPEVDLSVLPAESDVNYRKPEPKSEAPSPFDIAEMQRMSTTQLRDLARTADTFGKAEAIKNEIFRRRAHRKGGTTIHSDFAALQEAGPILKAEFDQWRVLKELPENQKAYEQFLAETGRFVSPAVRAAAGQKWDAPAKDVKIGEGAKNIVNMPPEGLAEFERDRARIGSSTPRGIGRTISSIDLGEESRFGKKGTSRLPEEKPPVSREKFQYLKKEDLKGLSMREIVERDSLRAKELAEERLASEAIERGKQAVIAERQRAKITASVVKRQDRLRERTKVLEAKKALVAEKKTAKKAAEIPPAEVTDVRPTLINKMKNSKFMAANPELKAITDKMIKRRAASQLIGKGIRDKFKHLAELTKSPEDLVRFQEALGRGEYPEVRKFFDDLHDDLTARGIEMGEKDNYLPQMWEGKTKDIRNAFGDKTMTEKASFQFRSFIEDYKTGIGKKLKPAKSPLELMEWYGQRANKLIADHAALKELKAAGYLNKKQLAGMKEMDPNLGTFKHHFAEPKVKHIIENYLKGAESQSGFGYAIRKASGKVTSTMLSAGIPRVPLATHHGIGMIIRAGLEHPKRMLKAIEYGLMPSRAAKVLEKENAAMIKATQDHDFSTRVEYTQKGKLFEDPDIGRTKKAFNWLSEGQHKLFEENLFEKMIPALKWDAWKANYAKLIKKGLSEAEAGRGATDITNSFYSGKNLDSLYHNRNFNTFFEAVTLAPNWLRSTLDLGGKIPKSYVQLLKNPKNPVARKYAAAGARMAAVYAGANLLQKTLTGKFMVENEPQDIFNLHIGETEEGQKRSLKLFGTAGDFARIPAQIISATMKNMGGGEALAGATEARLSPLITMALGMRDGEDYQGNVNFFGTKDTYGNETSKGKRILNTALQGLSYGPPQLSAPVERAFGRIGTEEMIAKLAEMPIKYSKKKKPGKFSLEMPVPGNKAVQFPRF